MQPCVIHGGGEVCEEVGFVRESIERTDRLQDAEVFRPRPLQQHGHAAILELGGDLSDGLRACRIEHLKLREPQDDDPARRSTRSTR